ncbi:MAG: hypothetical protein ABW066_11100 [Sedimenticola sp.]
MVEEQKSESQVYVEAFRGSFTSALRWHNLDDLWDALRSRADNDWYLYAVGEAPPEVPVEREKLLKFIDEVDLLLRNKRVFDLVMRFGTSKSPKRTRSSTAYLCPARPASVALRYAPSFRIPRQLPQMARRDYRMPTLFPLRVLRTLRVNSAS